MASKRFPRSGISTTFETGIEYVSPPSDWVQDSMFKMHTDEFGVQTLKRTYHIGRDKAIETYAPNKGDFDPQWRNLLVFDWELDATGPWYALTVQFIGFVKRPGAPLVRTLNDTVVREQVVYASLVNSTGDTVINLRRSLNIRYLAPQMVLRYALPYAPRFQNEYEDLTWKPNIQPISIVVDSGVVLNPDDLKQLMRFFNLRNQLRSVRVSVRDDQVGPVHYVTETIERQIIQTPTFSALKL